MINPAQARTYLEVAIFNPNAARELTRSAIDVLKQAIPVIMTTTGSYLLSDWVARRLNLPEGSRPEPGDFINMIQQAPIAPAKIATAGGGEQIEPPENLMSVRRSMAEHLAWEAADLAYTKAALRRTLRLKGIRV